MTSKGFLYKKIQIANPLALEADTRPAGALSSISGIVLCIPETQQRPIFYPGSGCVHCPRRIKCYSKVENLNWSISPSGFINGRLAWQFWGGVPFPSSISCQTLFSSRIPPMSYPFFQRRSLGISRIAPDVYTSNFSTLLFNILLLLLLQYLRPQYL